MRSPIYTKDRQWRMVSRPNGRWMVQHNFRGVGTPQHDPWSDMFNLTDYDTAKLQLASKGEIDE